MVCSGVSPGFWYLFLSTLVVLWCCFTIPYTILVAQSPEYALISTSVCDICFFLSAAHQITYGYSSVVHCHKSMVMLYIAAACPVSLLFWLALDTNSCLLVWWLMPRWIFAICITNTLLNNTLREIRSVWWNTTASTSFRHSEVLSVDNHILSYFLLFCIYISLLSCIWVSVATSSCSKVWVLGENNWIVNDAVLTQFELEFNSKNVSNEFLLTAYVRAVYYVLITLFTIGFGDIYPSSNSEVVFTLFVIVNGMILVALLISSISSTINNRDISTNSHRFNRRRLLQYYAQFNGISGGILSINDKTSSHSGKSNTKESSGSSGGNVTDQHLLRHYLDYMFDAQNGLPLTQLFNAHVLPPALLTRAYEQMYYDHAVNSSAYFKQAPPDFASKCIEVLEFVTFVPGSVVISQGDQLHRLLFIKTGRLEVFCNGVKHSLFALLPGDCYGDYEMLGCGSDHTCGVTIKTYSAGFSEVAVLHSDKFQGVLRKYKNLKMVYGNGRSFSPTSVEIKKLDLSVFHANGLEAVKKDHYAFVLKCHKMQSTMLNIEDQHRKMAAMLEKEVVHVKHSAYIIMPLDKFRWYWDIYMICCIVYIAVAIPIQLVIEYHIYNGHAQLQDHRNSRTSTQLWLDMSYFCNSLVYYGCFTPDLLLRSYFYATVHTADDDGIESVVTDHWAIWMQYKETSRFYISVCYCFPLEILTMLPLGINSLLSVGSVWSIPRLLSLWVYPLLLVDLQLYSENKYQRSVLSEELLIVLVLALATVVVIVWNSAIWSIVHYEGTSFVSSLYFTLTVMTTAGFGDITPSDTPQTIYITLFGMIGSTMAAIIIGYIASFVHCTEKSTESIEHRSTVILTFMEYMNAHCGQMRSPFSQEKPPGMNSPSIASSSTSSEHDSGCEPGPSCPSPSTACVPAGKRLARRASISSLNISHERVHNRNAGTNSNSMGAGSGVGPRSALQRRASIRNLNLQQTPTSNACKGTSLSIRNDEDLSTNGSGTNTNAGPCTGIQGYDELVQNLLSHYDYTEKYYNGFDGATLLPAYLPRNIRDLLHQNEEPMFCLQNLRIFKLCDESALKKLLGLFHRAVYTKGEVVTEDTARTTNFYYIASGVVCMKPVPAPGSENHSLPSDMEEAVCSSTGEHFGGVKLFVSRHEDLTQCCTDDHMHSETIPVKSQPTPILAAKRVQVVSDCLLYYLSKVEFMNFLDTYPLSEEVLEHMRYESVFSNRRQTFRRTSMYHNAVLQELEKGKEKERGPLVLHRVPPLQRSQHFNIMVSNNAIIDTNTSAFSDATSGLDLVKPTVIPKPQPMQAKNSVFPGFSLANVIKRMKSTNSSYAQSTQLSPCAASTEVCELEKPEEPSTNTDSDDQSVCSDEYDDVNEYEDRFILNPYGGYCALWSAMMLTCIVLHSLIWPFGLSYALSNPRNINGNYQRTFPAFFSQSFWTQPIVIVFYCTDILLWIDYILHSYVIGYYDNAELVVDRNLIANNYKTTYMYWVHMLSLIPIDCMFYCILVCVLPWKTTIGSGFEDVHSNDTFLSPESEDSTSFSAVQWLSFLRLLKILRVWELPCHWAIVESFVRENKHVNKLLKLQGFKNVATLLGLVCVLCYAALVMGNLFLLIGLQLYTAGDANNWISHYGILSDCRGPTSVPGEVLDTGIGCHTIDIGGSQRVDLYVFCLYWAISTLTTVGYGDIVPISNNEQLFNSVAFVVGTLVFSLIIVNLQDIIAELDVTEDHFKSHEEQVSTFLQRENTSKEYNDKVSHYFETLWTVSKGVGGAELSGYFSHRHYGHLMNSIVKPYLYEIIVFRSLNEDFVHACASSFMYNIYMTKDYVFRSNELATELYIIHSGEVSYVGEGNSEGTQYSSRTCGPIGDSEFLCKSCYNCSAICSSADITILFQLHFDIFWKLLKKYKLQERYVHVIDKHRETIRKASSTYLVQQLKMNLRNVKMLRMLTRRISIRSNESIILPESSMDLVWCVLSLLMLCYAAISIPYIIFLQVKQPDLWTVALDFCWLMYGIGDVFLRCCYLARRANGQVMDAPKCFRAHYIHKTNEFLLDSCGALPLYLCVIGIMWIRCRYQHSGSDSEYWFWMASWLRILYILKIHRFNELFDKIVTVCGRFLCFNVSNRHVRLVKGFIVLFYTGHVCACLFCYLGGCGVPTTDDDTWITVNEYTSLSTFNLYLRSAFLMMYTLSTVGYGSIGLATHAERIFLMGVMICGSLLGDAGVAAIMGTVITARDQQKNDLRKISEGFTKFYHTHKASKALCRDTGRYFQYVRDTMDSKLEKENFMHLSSALRIEFLTRFALPGLIKLNVFHSMSKDGRIGVCHSIIRLMELYIAIPQEVLNPCDLYVVRRGEITKCTHDTKPSELDIEMDEERGSVPCENDSDMNKVKDHYLRGLLDNLTPVPIGSVLFNRCYAFPNINTNVSDHHGACGVDAFVGMGSDSGADCQSESSICSGLEKKYEFDKSCSAGAHLHLLTTSLKLFNVPDSHFPSTSITSNCNSIPLTLRVSMCCSSKPPENGAPTSPESGDRLTECSSVLLKEIEVQYVFNAANNCEMEAPASLQTACPIDIPLSLRHGVDARISIKISVCSVGDVLGEGLVKLCELMPIPSSSDGIQSLPHSLAPAPCTGDMGRLRESNMGFLSTESVDCTNISEAFATCDRVSACNVGWSDSPDCKLHRNDGCHSCRLSKSGSEIICGSISMWLSLPTDAEALCPHPGHNPIDESSRVQQVSHSESCPAEPLDRYQSIGYSHLLRISQDNLVEIANCMAFQEDINSSPCAHRGVTDDAGGAISTDGMTDFNTRTNDHIRLLKYRLGMA